MSICNADRSSALIASQGDVAALHGRDDAAAAIDPAPIQIHALNDREYDDVMRRIFAVVFALVIVLVAYMGLLLYRASLGPEAAAPIGAAPSDALAAADRESPFTTPEPKETSNKLPMRLEPSEPKQEPEVALPKEEAIVSMKYPFPRRADITVGTSKPEILAIFGPPEATVSGTEGGQLQERLIYTDSPSAMTTAIAVINGKVTSAETYAAEQAQK